MSNDLREKVANRIFATGMLRERVGGDAALWEAALKMADFVLELPEIAEALDFAAQLTANKRAFDEADKIAKPLNPSLSTNRRTAV